jgi:hypothetical protein
LKFFRATMLVQSSNLGWNKGTPLPCRQEFSSSTFVKMTAKYANSRNHEIHAEQREMNSVFQ